jgi:hypothetical protein
MSEKKKIWTADKWYKESMEEFRIYKKTGKTIKLAQAGEKMWNSFTLYLDKKYNKELTSYREIKKAVDKDPEMKKIFDDAYWLHIFFYRGYTDYPPIEEEKFMNVSKKLRKVI